MKIECLKIIKVDKMIWRIEAIVENEIVMTVMKRRPTKQEALDIVEAIYYTENE